MLDLNYVRDHFQVIIEALEKRNSPTTSFAADFVNFDGQRRKAIAESDRLKAERNAISTRVGVLMKEGKRDEATSLRSEAESLKAKIAKADEIRDGADRRLRELLEQLPNIPHESVPLGKDESANVEIHRWGTKPEFDFEPKDHVDLGTALGILDLERATKIAGARFAILNGAGARLERALIDFMLELHTREHGYQETLPPFIVNKDALFGTGQLPKFEEDLFKLRDDRDLYLVPTAEVPVTNYYREEILDAAQLPMKFVAYTPCFRSEAGSYGKDTRGVIRQHHFEKGGLVK